jgi:hypothetical protein
MKEQELIKMVNTTKNIQGVNTALVSQMNNMKDLIIGAIETMKRMPGYEEALEQLKKDISEENKLEK